MGLNLLVTFIIAREFGASTLGIFSLTVSFIFIGAQLALMGLDKTIVKFIGGIDSNNAKGYIKDIYSKSVVIVLIQGVMITSLLILYSEVISTELLKKESLKIPLFFATFAILPLAFMQLNANAFRGRKKMGSFSFFSTASVGLFTLILLILIEYIATLNYSYLIAYIGAIYISFFVSFIFWLKGSGYFTNYRKHIVGLKKLLQTTLPFWFISLIAISLNHTDTLMLGIFCSEEDIGKYNIAFRMAALSSIVLMAINSIVAPKISYLYKSEKYGEMEYVVQKSTALIFWLSLPIFIIYIIFGTEVLTIFGSEFSVAFWALIILSVGQLFNTLTGPVLQVLNMTEGHFLAAKLSFIAAITNIGGNYLLIPVYGIEGAAFATSISIILLNTLSTVAIYRRLNIFILYIPWRKK